METRETLLHRVEAIFGVADALTGGHSTEVHIAKECQAGACRELVHLFSGQVILGYQDDACTASTYSNMKLYVRNITD
jgi:hypothetical protein